MRYAHCILLLALCFLAGCGTPATQQVASGQTVTATALATVTVSPTSSPTQPAPTQPAPTLIPTSVPATPTVIPPTAAPSTPTTVPATPTAVPPTAVPEPAAPAEFVVISRSEAIVTVAADGSTRPITIDGIELRSGQVVVSSDGSWIAGPTRSPHSDTTQPPLEPGLVLYNTSSGERQVLPQPGSVSNLLFAPDNTSLLFTVQNWEPTTWQINILDLRTRQQRTVHEGVDGESRALVPSAWTPAGILTYRYLVFGADDVPTGLFLINPSDGSVQTLEDEGYLRAVPAPDGKQVAIVRGTVGLGIENPTASLAILDLASGAIKEIEPEQPGGMGYISWSPDSTKLIYQQPGTDWASGSYVIVGPAITEPQRLTLPVAMQQLRQLSWRDSKTLLLLLEEASADSLYELPIAAPEAGNLKPVASIPAGTRQGSSSIVYIAGQ